MPKLDHIAIVTSNLREALEFYQQSLGLSCSHTEEIPERGIRVAFLPVGDTRLELIEPMNSQSEVSNFLSKRGPGLHHLAFEMETGQRAESIKTIGPFEAGAHGAQVAFVHPKNTGGVLIELCVP